MRIALLSPPYLANYMRNARCDFVSLSATQWYPLWLGYAGAWLEKCGHEVTLIDAPSAHLDYEATKRLVMDWHPDMLVVYPGQRSRINDIEIADRLTEQANCIGVLVGPYFTPRACPDAKTAATHGYQAHQVVGRAFARRSPSQRTLRSCRQWWAVSRSWASRTRVETEASDADE